MLVDSPTAGRVAVVLVVAFVRTRIRRSVASPAFRLSAAACVTAVEDGVPATWRQWPAAGASPRIWHGSMYRLGEVAR